jgi:hypothetical protein
MVRYFTFTSYGKTSFRNNYSLSGLNVFLVRTVILFELRVPSCSWHMDWQSNDSKRGMEQSLSCTEHALLIRYLAELPFSPRLVSICGVYISVTGKFWVNTKNKISYSPFWILETSYIYTTLWHRSLINTDILRKLIKLLIACQLSLCSVRQTEKWLTIRAASKL